MRDFDPMDSFGDDVADRYDDEPRGDEEDCVACLARLAAGRPTLELAIGTGRIGLPLAATGLQVDGIEQSEAMVAKLRAKPGGPELDVTIGDMAEVAVPGRYGLVYLLFNTLLNLLTQDDQVRCFENAAAHLAEDGVFLVEAILPDSVGAFRSGQHVEAERVELQGVMLDVGRYDRVTQVLAKSHVRLSDRGVRVDPIALRMVWPSELDLMARIAGLRLYDRWSGWNREPFDNHSRRHVSVYGR